MAVPIMSALSALYIWRPTLVGVNIVIRFEFIFLLGIVNSIDKNYKSMYLYNLQNFQY